MGRILGLNSVLGLLRTFLILTAAPSTGFALSSVLYNVFYGLAEATQDWPVVPHVMNALEVGFFIVALLVCPVAFTVGAVGTVVMLIRRQREPG